MDDLYGSNPDFPDVRRETEQRLREENKRLRAALRAIIELPDIDVPMDTEFGAGFYVALGLAKDIAREALGKGE